MREAVTGRDEGEVKSASLSHVSIVVISFIFLKGGRGRGRQGRKTSARRIEGDVNLVSLSLISVSFNFLSLCVRVVREGGGKGNKVELKIVTHFHLSCVLYVSYVTSPCCLLPCLLFLLVY